MIEATHNAEVVVRDLLVEADIGVNPDEIGRRQPLRLTVRMAIQPPAADAIEATIDYRWVEAAATALAAQRIVLIERFAYELATRCLAHRYVLSVLVIVVKPRALTNGVAEVRVRMERGAAG